MGHLTVEIAGAAADYNGNPQHVIVDSGGGGGAQFAEDSAAVDASLVTLAGVVRQDALVASVSTDGDVAWLKVDSLGRLWTIASSTIVRAATGAAPTAFTSTISAVVFASNAIRKLFTVFNNSDKDLYLMLAAAPVSATSYHTIVKANGGYFATSDYSGEIRGIMAAAITTGQVNPSEFT